MRPETPSGGAAMPDPSLDLARYRALASEAEARMEAERGLGGFNIATTLRLINALSEMVEGVEQAESRRDADWILALGHAAGLDSGLAVPIIPEVETVKHFLDRIATAERERLAGMSAAEDRGMVLAYGLAVAAATTAQISGVPSVEADALLPTRATLLATLAARRAQALEEWIDGLTTDQLWALGQEAWYPFENKRGGEGLRAGAPTAEIMWERLRALATPATRPEGEVGTNG